MRILLIFMLLTTYAQAQQVGFEQKAFDYFANEIIRENYQEAKYVYFTGQSEMQQTIAGPFFECFESDKEFEDFFYKVKKNNATSVPINIAGLSSVQASKKIKSNKLNLKIYRAVVNNEDTYVYIKVFKKKRFVDHYLLKISSSKKEVVDICRINEMI